MADSLKVLADSVQKLMRRNAQRNLRKILEGSRPQDLAGLLGYLPEHDRIKIFLEIPDRETRAEVLAEINIEILPTFLEALSDEELVPLLEEMFSDDTVDILEFIPEERKNALLRKMRREDMDEAEELLRYDPDTAGGIMVPDFFALPELTTCKQAIETLQQRNDELEMAFYVYVINEHEHLVGVLSLRQLVISPPNAPLAEIMETEVVRVQTSDDQEAVARLVARYNILAIPVVDDTNRLVGIVTVDDVIDVIREEATEDILKMAGAGDANTEFAFSSVWRSTRSRIPWLFASWLGGLLASSIIYSYEERLARIAILAAFIPIVLGMGGNVGTQALTVVTRGLALGHISGPHIPRTVGREVLVGLSCGATYGGLLGAAATGFAAFKAGAFQLDALLFGATIGFSLCTAMVIAALVGSTVPMILQRLSIDPAVATGPFVTTSVDVLGIVVYFNLASLLLGI